MRSNSTASSTPELVEGLRAHADLAKRFDLRIGVAGIIERTALALLIRMPELGTLSREQVAALARLAPFDDHSGKRPFGGLRRKPPYRRWTRSRAKKSL
ncbi:MAG: transposase, partial [Methylocella sp.]